MIKTKKRFPFDSVSMKDDVIMRELSSLPENYYIFKDAHVSLNQPVKYRGSQEKIIACQYNDENDNNYDYYS